MHTNIEGFHRDSDIYVHMYICKIRTREAKYGGMILTLSIGSGAIFSPPLVIMIVLIRPVMVRNPTNKIYVIV